MIRVLIVDDSGFMRLALRKLLEGHQDIRVIAEATSGDEAVNMARVHRPDLITMDVEMPGSDGLSATARIMKDSPTPIIMVSSLTAAAGRVTMEAMSLGAVDFIPKASSFVDLDIISIERELVEKIRFWAQKQSAEPPRSRSALPHTRAGLPKQTPEIIAIGASTGGPRILPELFRTLNPLSCPVVIALHMPPVYTSSFAQHLRTVTGHDAVESSDREKLQRGRVYIAPGGRDSVLTRNSRGELMLRIMEQSDYSIHPSVDALFLSTASVARSALGIVLTGMGNDGMQGAIAMRKQDFPVLTQAANDCLVYGMPRAVLEAGASSESITVVDIRERLKQWTA